MRRIDLTGKVFGRWTVLASAGRTTHARWLCVCTCGSTRTVSGPNLASGKSTSCGCYRNELRPTYAARRDYSGIRNPRAKQHADRFGDLYVPSSNVWYKRAAGVYYTAKRTGVPVEFDNAMEFAAYVKSIALDRCPVFGVPFVERGVGFNKWSPSIDKIDPARGYARGNVQVISMLANCMKRDASPTELTQFARWALQQGTP